ncbi:hypothetical protein EN866_19610 [Mesorhizobium sp. M2D.F.Ca.ET.223.01.1.1]|uniref:hypothetical protein n=1 Tax=unclassified Mesorhizobium TaxID=325217 RepID=UPI000FCBDCC5|nr:MULTISPECIES: hypothetical protein [unclassified Mesorhizobium]TGP89369.1 hypothetical protein EN864_19620 [bacterium M00.F.Ca.ET.221.01.1.1]TGP94742.1 hypothetical protein EN865_15490 [bacterium M00.F.Ca.ET.222.01.1.1]RVD58844.1 hypothetical protein EN783_14505 [Mesorhizobium sp. M2D.F.Ca.ET.140.01.1.1]TGP27872.1 hypothetical protein EN875_032985 [Mesorhizobium sp. M2D.F.Ca.ET.232.01.1.1]TGP75910.1 hypothetical protein EN867_15490 [Mesorhizobium sp. M2D.F.Ca.ET.224.01.1.1]
MKRFAFRIGQGRTPFYFVGHGFGSQNHHVHFEFFDRHVETGKRVYGTSERGSTARLKLDWEIAANSVFEELGYDVRVKVHDGYPEELAPANDNASLRPDKQMEPTAVSEESPVDLDDPEDEELAGDEIGKVDLATIGVDPVANIRFLHDQVAEREALRAARDRIEQARNRYLGLVAERERVAKDAGDYYQESLQTLMDAHTAQERLEHHRRSNGQLKGREFAVFGVSLFKTKARKQAEQVQAEAHDLRLEANKIEYTRKSYDQRLYQLDSQATQAEQDAFTHQANLTRVYGNDEEVAMAEDFIERAIDDAAHIVSLEDAMSAYLEGEITPDEYRTFLREGGYTAELQLLEDQLSEGEGESL